VALFCALIGFAIVLIGRVGPARSCGALVLIPIYVTGTPHRQPHRQAGRRPSLRRIVLVMLLATAIAGLIVQTTPAHGGAFQSEQSGSRAGA
jgi:hypothetical protein